MFCKHIIKNDTCFGHNCLTIFRGQSFVLSAVTASPLVCFIKLFSVLNINVNVCFKKSAWVGFEQNKYNYMHGVKVKIVIQGDSVARGPKSDLMILQ
jgi:hypothetical protein